MQVLQLCSYVIWSPGYGIKLHLQYTYTVWGGKSPAPKAHVTRLEGFEGLGRGAGVSYYLTEWNIKNFFIGMIFIRKQEHKYNHNHIEI